MIATTTTTGETLSIIQRWPANTYLRALDTKNTTRKWSKAKGLTYDVKRDKRADGAAPAKVDATLVVAVVRLLHRLDDQTGQLRGGWAVQLKGGTVRWEDITAGKVGRIDQRRRRPAVNGVDGHAGGVAPVPEDQLNGVVGGRQRQVAGQLCSPTNHWLDFAKDWRERKRQMGKKSWALINKWRSFSRKKKEKDRHSGQYSDCATVVLMLNDGGTVTVFHWGTLAGNRSYYYYYFCYLALSIQLSLSGTYMFGLRFGFRVI